MNLAKKECVGCFELINEKAQKCPHCHQIQSKILSPKYVKWALVPVLVLALGMVIYGLFGLGRVATSSPPRALVVESETLYQRNVSGRDFVSCSGVISNSTALLDGTYIYLRADFYNKNGEVIDTLGNGGRFKVMAHSKSPYRVRGEADKPLSEYNKCTVTVLE